MEQAVNLFNEGLLSDTNPMILGNKTLTDCLNGTLVTMNGNEIALQNDMGNIRIDNAYLSSGYEPVGIKEYGGVIYIAAYNPITNKSQIGSFPSPERRIDVEEEDSGSFDFNNFSSPNNKEESSDLGIIVLKDDSRLIPLTYDDKTLHVGDKFVVYSEKLSELKDQISNYNNVNNTNINNTSFSKWKECTIDEYNVISDNNLKTIKYYKKENESSDWEECSLEEYNNIQDINLKAFKYCRREYVYKVYSPKNKKYTLSLGVLNEQNNFNDITSSLVRWNNVDYWKEVSIGEYNQELNEENKKQEGDKYYIKTLVVGNIIKDLEDKSDLYKFNVGYFIPDGFIKDKDVDGQTISDTKLISERKKIAANTFSYKLSGPLYLKVNYNHVSNFYCNITGKNIPGNQIELTLTARFTYNCPDTSKNVTYEPNEGDDDYYTYEILKNGIDIDPNLIGFDFFVNGDNKSSNITPIYKDFSYDKFNDVYYVTEELEIVLDIPEDHILEYVIGVKSGLSHNKTIYTDEKEISYIKGLSYKGTINTDLLNSGELNLTLYRFYNNSKSKDSILQLGFEAYPKERESFENLTLTFENIDSNKTSDLGVHYLYTKQPLINGQQIINFNLEKSLVDENGEEFPLQERNTYKVHIIYDKIKDGNSTEVTYDEENLIAKLKPGIIKSIERNLKESAKNIINSFNIDEEDEIKLKIIDNAVKYNKRFFYNSENLSDAYSDFIEDNVDVDLFDYFEFIDVAPLTNNLYLFRYEEKLLKDTFHFLDITQTLQEIENIVNNIHNKFYDEESQTISMDSLYKFYGLLFYDDNLEYLYYLNDEYHDIISDLSTYDGNPIIKITSENVLTFKEKQLYTLTYFYVYFPEYNNDLYGRWFLTTELFNDLYITSLSDYCNPEYTDNNELFLKKINIKPDINNLEGIYLIIYGDVTYYDPSDTNINTNIIPMYRVGEKSSDSIILYQTIDIIKKLSSKKLDVSLYPNYIEDIYLNISGGEDKHLINSETIEMLRYEPLDTIYNPLRTIEQQKDRITFSLIGAVRSVDRGGTHNYIHCRIYIAPSFRTDLYKDIINRLNESSGQEEIIPDSYVLKYDWIEPEASHPFKSYEMNYSNLSDVDINSTIYKGFYFPAVFEVSGDGTGGSNWQQIGGPCFGILDSINNELCFTNHNPLLEFSSGLINWNEISTSGSSVLKIIGTVPDVKEFSEKLNYSVMLDPEWRNVQIGNLIFTINRDEFLFEQNIFYHNKKIVETYLLYKYKSFDSYVDMGTGNKIINTNVKLISPNFIIENFNTLKYINSVRYTFLAHGYCGEGTSQIAGYTDLGDW